MSTVKDSNGRKVDGLGQLDRGAAIDVLPNEVLLEIFNFYLDGGVLAFDAWHELVHVCRRWRQVVFASPRRLNLRLLCTDRRPMKTLLDTWPALPIVIEDYITLFKPTGMSNVIGALQHNDRICKITRAIRDDDPFLNSMKQPFPALTDLHLWSHRNMTLLPESFLGGSAPCLQNLTLRGVLFPGLPKLLLSAHRLVRLRIHDIPDSGFISPEAMVTCLSSLTNLELLSLKFQSPRPRPDQTNPPPLTRTTLPSLTAFQFEGVGEYLEDVVARIDVPLLNDISITFFHQLIFDTPLLRGFISRAEVFKTLHRAEILFSYFCANVTLLREGVHKGMLRLGISCDSPDGQLSFMVQVFKSLLPPLPTLEHLNICEYRYGSHWQDGMEDIRLLELLHRFIKVKSLYLDKKVAPYVASGLQTLARERVTEVLPALQNLFVEGPVHEAFAQFISTRQLLGQVVAVQDWDGRGDQRLRRAEMYFPSY